MKLSDPQAATICTDHELFEQYLALEGADILDLGCGRAEHSRWIAQSHPSVRVTAMEIDREQHVLNCRTEAPTNLAFVLGGAEAIPSASASIDIVLMIKSLHHVPRHLLDVALEEVIRVLRPGGMAYISEPIFDGPLNEIMRIFHDEQQVRLDAFEALRRMVEKGALRLIEERFFSVPTRFRDFADFEDRVLRVTHTRHRLERRQMDEVIERFAEHMSAAGAQFAAPQRLDLLRKD
jgi:ubiquinone/menaquinone biosynthesis C-methylase UbiE